MSKFTVVLIRPLCMEHLTQADYDVYVATRIEAESCTAALKAAQQEVYVADTKEYGKKAMHAMQLGPDDYELLVMFEGHHDPVLYGFQL